MRWLSRVFFALGVISLALVDVGPADAVRLPKTLARVDPISATAVQPGFPVDFVGVQWDGRHGEASIRFRRAGGWGPWQALEEDGIEVPGQFASGLASAGDADSYQVMVHRASGGPER